MEPYRAFIKSYEKYCDSTQLTSIDKKEKFMRDHVDVDRTTYATLAHAFLNHVSNIIILESDRAIERLNEARVSYKTAIEDRTQKQDRKDLLGKHQECVTAILHINTAKSKIANGILVGNADINAGKTNISFSSAKTATSDGKIVSPKLQSTTTKTTTSNIKR